MSPAEAVSTRGAWRVSDGSQVDGAQARAAWVEAARPVLLAAARRYGDLISTKNLAEAVQSETGIRTKQRVDSWIGDVLGTVAAECAAKGEPLLCAFCVRADETVGSAYVEAARAAYGEAPEDPEVHAAEERLKAHRFFEAEGIPADGGRAKLPPKIANKRVRDAKNAPRIKGPICPIHFLEYPANGKCGFCGDEL